MPRTEQHYRDLPPAKLSKQQIQEISDALPPYFEEHLTWSVWAGKTRIDEYTLIDLFESVKGVQGITELSLSVAVEGQVTVTLDLTCGEEGSWLGYSFSPEESGEIQNLARVIEGVFRDNRRRGWWLPWIRAPIIELGKQPKRRLNLSWDRIVENVISNWLSYLLIAITGFIIGLLVGKFF